MPFALRYDMRNPDFGATATALYRASIEQAAWADEAGFTTVYVAEHHGADDGYCPSPIVQAAAMFGVTSRIGVHLSALLAALHDPLRLAEDLAILDVLSAGRVEVTLGLGYRPHEYAMFGVAKRDRVARFEETVSLLRAAWSGEPFEHRGQLVQILPKPCRSGGPPLYVGGSAAPSARRAARLGDGYMPAVGGLYGLYLEECERLGRRPGPKPSPPGPLFLHVSDDPDRDWPIVAPHVIYTAASNAAWALERGVGATPYPPVSTLAELKAHGSFLVVTPEQCLEHLAALRPDTEVQFQPLMGGLDPDVGWASLELFAAEVLPRLETPMTIAIAGVGETEPSWSDPRAVPELCIEACRLALADAGIDPADVDGFVTEAATLGNQAPIDEVAQRLGVRDRPFSAQVGIAGSGTVGAAMLAQAAIEGDLAHVVVAYYGINLSRRGRNPAGFHASDPAKASFEMPMGYYGQPVYFAAQAARYAHQYGLTEVELGAVACSARRWAERTPGALRRKPLTVEDYLADAYVAEPLRRLDCCLVNDCGVAWVMTSLEAARHLRHPPVIVAGTGFGSKTLTQAQYFSQGDILATAATDSGGVAYRRAGLGPSDVDVAEIYDCSTISMMLQLEDLGLAPRGESAARAAGGEHGPGGRLPVNTHGGLLSHSYSVGGGHVVEAVRQVRGERADAQVPGAEVALVCGLGAPETATAILTADR